ncbi:MAG: hypothetical protein ACE5LF_01790 [Alphaproteobacteria bacterium]
MPGRKHERRAVGGRLAVPLALAAALVVSACPRPDQVFAPADATAGASSRTRDWQDFPDLDFTRPAPAETEARLVPAEPWPAAPPPPAWREVARLAPTPPLNDDPKQVMGLDDTALEALIGPPGLRRDEPPAQVWQYRGESCVLDVFLYPDDEAEPHRVVYYEIRGDGDGALARRRCFRALLQGHGQI